jgi:hypothetical protein
LTKQTGKIKQRKESKVKERKLELKAKGEGENNLNWERRKIKAENRRKEESMNRVIKERRRRM